MIRKVSPRWILCGYTIALISLLYLGLSGLISSSMRGSLPNTLFILSMCFLSVGAWGLGLGIRNYTKNLDQVAETLMKKRLILLTAFGWLIVLGSISFFPIVFI
ncbi:hypothetical protein M3197_11365 [Sporosarcina aquimarina]|uniref:hypothetical protein n=1 Tax=Sporosarcina aquimarina TaxID=114975 RepID=UPI00203FFCEF|nr:hypothetical protein [Sporosarcina aquimarina]MCM3758063.1 hypothetical protein [Sporosarcina aquimarina]